MLLSNIFSQLHKSKDTIIAVFFLLWITGWLVFIAFGITTSILWNIGIDLRPYIDNAPYEVKAKEKTEAREKWERANPVEAAKQEREFKNHLMLTERIKRECAAKCLRQNTLSFEACYEIECQ